MLLLLRVHFVHPRAQSRPAVHQLLVLFDLLHSICFANGKHCYIVLAHLVCLSGGPSRLVQGAAILCPNPSPAFHLQNKFRPSGFPWDFTRWHYAALRRDLNRSQAGCCKHFFCFCSRSIHWWVISPVSFTSVPVGQHVSEYIHLGFRGYRTSLPYFACFHPLGRGRGDCTCRSL